MQLFATITVGVNGLNFRVRVLNRIEIFRFKSYKEVFFYVYEVKYFQHVESCSIFFL